MTRYGKRDHSLLNDNAEKMAKIHGQVGIYGIGNESSMGKYNHLPTVWQKQGLSATFVEGAVASLPPLLPRAGNINSYILFHYFFCGNLTTGKSKPQLCNLIGQFEYLRTKGSIYNYEETQTHKPNTKAFCSIHMTNCLT